MQKTTSIVTGILGFIALFTPFAFASAASVSVMSLAPGVVVQAKNSLSFNLLVTGFTAQGYSITDSFSPTTVSAQNIDPSGKFFWTPIASDVGEHKFTVRAFDYNGNAATTTQTITVAPPASVSIQSVSPVGNIMPGTKLTFKVVPQGFTNPTYVVGDAFSGSSVGNVNIDASGNFSWTPEIAQNGPHTITVYASDSLGHSGQASLPVTVGTGPTLTVQSLSPGSAVSLGQTVSFMVSSLNFAPTGFTLNDAYSGPGKSSITNLNITQNGLFSWMPQAADAGTHVINVKGQVGAYGDSASSTVTINVLGPGGVLPTVSTTSTTTPSSNDTLLASLKAQLAEITAKMLAKPNTNPTPSTSSGHVFSVYLKPGSEGEDVMALQNYLIQKGYLSSEATGYYGSKTVDAVVKLQAANGLSQLGVVGPATRALLNSALAGASATTNTTTSVQANSYVFENFIGVGSEGTDVTELQKRLTVLGFFSGEATGYFGSRTEQAVKEFQTSRGIRAAGYVGPATRDALNN
jgi:peptidoglycan hydrolase-like protein with peptidoglycan-binding domain